jgi:hypothetical protein
LRRLSGACVKQLCCTDFLHASSATGSSARDFEISGPHHGCARPRCPRSTACPRKAASTDLGDVQQRARLLPRSGHAQAGAIQQTEVVGGHSKVANTLTRLTRRHCYVQPRLSQHHRCDIGIWLDQYRFAAGRDPVSWTLKRTKVCYNLCSDSAALCPDDNRLVTTMARPQYRACLQEGLKRSRRSAPSDRMHKKEQRNNLSLQNS